MDPTAPWEPPEAVAAKPDVWTPPEAGTDSAAQAATGPDWNKLFSGVDGLDKHLSLDQRAAFSSLDKLQDDNLRQTRAQSVNLAYVSSKLPQVDPADIQHNWPGVKQAFAKQALGIDRGDISDTELYSAIGEHEKALQVHTSQEFNEASVWGKIQLLNKLYDAHKGENVKKVWDDANKPFKPIPRLDQLPDMWIPTGAGVPANPAVIAGVYNSVMPLIEGVETPLGVATLGAGAELNTLGKTVPLAKKILGGMSGIFTGLMAKSTYDQAKNIPAVVNDPKATLQDKIQVIGTPVATGAATLLGAMGTVAEFTPGPKGLKLADELRGKNPGEGAAILRRWAETSTDPDQHTALHDAANKMELISQPVLDALDKVDLKEGESVHIENGKPVITSPEPLPPQTQVTVMEMGGKRAVQIDIPGEGDRPGFSGSPEDAAKAGFVVPDLGNAAEGQHTISELTKAQEPPTGRAIITPTESGYVVTAGDGRLLDYADTPEEAHKIASRHNMTLAESEVPTSSADSEVEPVSPMETKPPESAEQGRQILGTTGIKNASVDAELASMGKPPATHGERLSAEAAHADALKKVQADPTAGTRLVEDLSANPRPVTGEEDALLLFEANRLKQERGAAEQAFVEAKNMGDSAGMADARARVMVATDSYAKAADVFTTVGTKNAIGLALRRMMIKDDYSLAAVERRQIVANEGSALSEKSAVENKELVAQLKELQDAFDKRLAEKDQQLADSAMDKALLKIYRDSAAAVKKEAAPKAVKRFLGEQADAARLRIRQRISGDMSSASLFGADIIADYVIIGADHFYTLASKGAVQFKEWAEPMIKEFGQAIEPHLPDIFAKSKEAQENAPKLAAAARTGIKTRATVLEAIKTKLGEGRTLDDMAHYVQQLAKQFVAEGIHGREELIDKVHEALAQVAPDLTRRQTMDSISGYGDFRQMSKDEVDVRLRDLKGQMQQLGKLQDMAEGRAPQKTGIERRAPTQTERDLIRQVNEEKKRASYGVTDPAAQLKTTVQTIDTRLTNQIADLEQQLRTGELFDKTKGEPPTTAEIEAKRARLDELKEQREYARHIIQPDAEPPTPVEKRVASLDKQITEIERQIKDREPFSKGKKEELDSPEIAARKNRLDQLKEERGYLRESLQPKPEVPTPEELQAKAIQAVKKRLHDRIADMKERLANQDFTPRPKRTEQLLDQEATTMKANAERIKGRLRQKELEYEKANRPGWIKSLDFTAKWFRAAALSSPVTFAKLALATVSQAILHPLDEMAGSIYSRAFSRAADRAQIEGSGFSFTQSVKAATSGIMDGWKDMRDSLSKAKGNKSELEALYGKGGMPPEALEFFGLLHGAEKAFLKRGMFTYAMEKQVAYALSHGLDVTDPGVQMRMGVESYKYANRKIFQEDNVVSEMFNRGLSVLREKDKVTGKESVGRRLAEAGIRSILPVAKVGTNVVLQSFERAFGSIRGAGELATAYARGIDKLRPEEADMIFRHLKQGSVGGALLLAGYFMPDIAGGFYRKGEKRSSKDVKSGEIRSPVELPKFVSSSGNIPAYALHNPGFEALQFGASIRRVADAKLRKKDKEAQGLTEGMMAATLGLAAEAPYFREAQELVQASEPGRTDHFLGGLALGAVPQAVQWLARQMDKNDKGEVIKRDPKTIVQTIETGIPGLRGEVPKKK